MLSLEPDILKQCLTDKLLGEGAFSKIYLGQLEGLGPVAIKVITGSPVDDVMQEISIMNSMTHRNVLEIVAFYQSQNEFFMVFPVFQMSLKQGLRILNWEQRAEVVMQIAEGLEYIHKAGVIHFDCKTSNILLNIAEDGRTHAAWADFGLSARLSEIDCTHIPIRGTPGYISPEYYERSGAMKGFMVISDSMTAVDLYAFGVIIAEVVSGKQTFIKQKRGAIHIIKWCKNYTYCAARVLDRRLNKTRVCWNDVENMLQVIRRCTNPDPQQRLSMNAVLDILVTNPVCSSGEQTTISRRRSSVLDTDSGDDAESFGSIRSYSNITDTLSRELLTCEIETSNDFLAQIMNSLLAISKEEQYLDCLTFTKELLAIYQLSPVYPDKYLDPIIHMLNEQQHNYELQVMLLDCLSRNVKPFLSEISHVGLSIVGSALKFPQRHILSVIALDIALEIVRDANTCHSAAALINDVSKIGADHIENDDIQILVFMFVGELAEWVPNCRSNLAQYINIIIHVMQVHPLSLGVHDSGAKAMANIKATEDPTAISSDQIEYLFHSISVHKSSQEYVSHAFRALRKCMGFENFSVYHQFRSIIPVYASLYPQNIYLTEMTLLLVEAIVQNSGNPSSFSSFAPFLKTILYSRVKFDLVIKYRAKMILESVSASI